MRNFYRDYKNVIKLSKRMDPILVITTILILFIGVVTIHSAAFTKKIDYGQKQIWFIIIAAIVYIAFSVINYRSYARYAKVIYIFNIILLISVYIFGSRLYGATRWIRLGPINIQPSEFAKLFIVLTFSEYLINGMGFHVKGFRYAFRCFLHIIPVFLLILKQPDLGTSLVLMFLYVLLVFIDGIELRVLFSMIGTGIISSPFIYFFVLKDYQRIRIKTFINPEAYPLESGWNIIQSKIAVGSGQIMGKGLFNGTQSKLKFLPEAHTDFIYSVLTEETGFIGGIFLLFLFLALVYFIVKIGSNCEDQYGKFIAYGIAGIIFFHTVVNVGMTMGVMPVTGLPLLLVSYGGSSLVFTAMMLGIVQSIKIHGNK